MTMFRNLALILGSVVFSFTAQANLIANGEFEDQAISSGVFDYVLSLSGWTVTDVSGPYRGAVLFNAGYQPVGDGQSLQLEDHGDSISQTLATVVGQTYELTFDMSAYPSPGTAMVRVDVGTFSDDFTGTFLDGYVAQSALFTATSTDTLITFESLASGDVRYPHLDNIVVQAVPAPAGILLLGLGLLVLGSARR